MRVLFADSNHPILHEQLLKQGFECDLFWERSAEELIELLPQYDALVIRSKFKITAKILTSAIRLKCIGRVGAGLENIDIDFANKQGISCLSVPEGNRDAVGEHALGMLLMLLNKLKKADEEVRLGIWKRAENRGTEISKKTVGIIGFGHMGSSFAKKLSGFDCEILAYDKYKSGFSNDFVKEAKMQQLFDECDILSIHLPLTSETQNLINADFISKFKKSIYIINTARGRCLNTEDLVKALETNKVLGACLDVLEYESVSFESIPMDQFPAPLQFLVKSEKVVLSPHIAGWTHESNYKMSKIIADKMIQVLSTKN
jgi:D-3-phosphoglycerate dehydrogenase / 2-oxoglutarate reductase